MQTEELPEGFHFLLQAGKDTIHSSGYPRSPPIIIVNFACANDYFVSRKSKEICVILV